MTKLMITTFALLSFFGCTDAQKKELVSVSYHRSGMRSDDRINIRAAKIAETYTVEFEKGEYKENGSTSFEITKTDFDSLANILFAMKKPGINRPDYVRDLSEHLKVKFVKNGKEVSRDYSINQFKSRKNMELENQAIDLLYQWIDKYKKQSEIRIYYSKGIATPTEIYTHAEPADLVEDLGEFIERLDPNRHEQTGGSNDYSHRWRAVKPGIVTVWLNELELGYDASKLTEEYEPYGCYIIDENLNVHYSKEDTEAARKQFEEQKNKSY